ncbi:1-deoxy-D-xylulose-5-phosphate reductoisomerase [Idiomarina xiamenensis]|uniref:1-deoxy-D-xylulose 5-phosphate reductoisomerase n=1 Tax=Idiomarina xiamenensis 10-D-4 TaxID=740709 RepID=K2KQW0_9GAMM|nr:1-deoxy-D-xylulose-5-phosphate reductoisomerase [Idiomarina xiamenensis]EKE84844.1 1-deoxy-D-xylulose 5-phosphate reductoisomerase [Idiomarina xiamenensis 10-D-4]
MTTHVLPQRVTILGASGSIGQNTLDVIERHPQQFQLHAISAYNNVDAMLESCRQYQPQRVVMVDTDAAQRLHQLLQQHQLSDIQVDSGAAALLDIAGNSDSDIVMAAIVGAAGLLPTLAAIKANKRVLLANKEALVMSGQLFIDALAQSNAMLLPVDSEHNAIFQCLPSAAQQQIGQQQLAEHGISQILLTGSGGPFRQTPLAQLAKQSPAAACAHPNWSMGQKISVDSATMLNKGLEYIEARWLFNCQRHELAVLLHPQSVIHSMVQYQDGSVIAQLGQPDMRTPIAYSLSYPERIDSGVAALDFTQLSQLTFAQACPQRYPCLQLAIDACWAGQAATTCLNAANELAVEAFLQERIGFTQIAEVCAQALAVLNVAEPRQLDDILAIDEQTRCFVREHLRSVAA